MTDALEERYLTPGKVADLLGVDPKTVSRWARTINQATGKARLESIMTPGGHRRFPESAVRAILEARS